MSEDKLQIGKLQCWQCEADLTNEPIPHTYVNWVRHCRDCYEMKRNWSFEIQQEKILL